jgi:hypothetical protein
MPLATTDPRTGLCDAFVAYVAGVLAEMDAYNARLDSALTDHKQHGARIITGGQTAEGWHILDWHSGEVLASGHGDYDEYERVCDELDPGATWVHIDGVRDPIAYDVDSVEVPASLPATLAGHLVDWVENNEADARAVIAAATPEVSEAHVGRRHSSCA